MFFTNFEEMSDGHLKFEIVRLTLLHEQTSDGAYKRLADKAEGIRMNRMLSQPNPYEVNRDERATGRAAGCGG